MNLTHTFIYLIATLLSAALISSLPVNKRNPFGCPQRFWGPGCQGGTASNRSDYKPNENKDENSSQLPARKPTHNWWRPSSHFPSSFSRAGRGWDALGKREDTGPIPKDIWLVTLRILISRLKQENSQDFNDDTTDNVLNL